MSKEEKDNIIDYIDNQEDIQPTKKTNGSRNRNVGNNLERELVNTLKVIFPDITTSRNNSRVRDASGVDLMNKDEHIVGRLPYNIQAKCLAKHVDYTKVLSEMPKGAETNVIIHRKTKKSEKSGRFMTQGTYAIMEATDFYKLIEDINNLQNYKDKAESWDNYWYHQGDKE